tara:strand:- start:1280 stop:1945 length:666 start_codon:yes stop_codon:yes gene_type:complete
MIKSNNVDIFLLSDELSNIFSELTLQFKSKKSNFVSQFNITEDLSKINSNLITILDDAALENLIGKKFVPNNYLFIIGKINQDFTDYLNDNLINYEYFEPPISLLKLLNRCDNLLRETNNSQSEIIDLKHFSYSFNLNTIYVGNSSLYLTDKENEIFQFLIANIGNKVARKQLLSKVWSYNENIDTHTLETHIYTLRKKIKKKLGLTNLILHKEDGYQVKV